jgi:Protein of unknown function (DUF3995)
VTQLIALLIGGFLSVGAAFHFYWGFGGQYGRRVAVPQRLDGTPLFAPSAAATLGVALGLTLIVALLAAYATRLDLPVPRNALRIAMAALAMLFLARGLSWHPYAGLFKRVRTTDFARNDTWLYSPGCLVAGLGFLLLAWEG